jgi:hypothetical protein
VVPDPDWWFFWAVALSSGPVVLEDFALWKLNGLLARGIDTSFVRGKIDVEFTQDGSLGHESFVDGDRAHHT